MLKTRVITACCLLAGLVLGLLALPYVGLVLFFSAIFLLAAGEWANISGLTQRWQQYAYAGCMACVMYLLFIFGVHHAGVLLNALLVLSLLGWLFVLIMIGIDAPAAVYPIDNKHTGENVAEIGTDFR